MEIQSTCDGEDSSVNFFSDEIRNRMCRAPQAGLHSFDGYSFAGEEDGQGEIFGQDANEGHRGGMMGLVCL